MSGLSIFIFMAILWMVLVINSTQVIWTYIFWMTTLLSKTNGRQNATIIWQTMKKGLQICPSALECVSKYTFFIAYTMLCMALKTMILPVWTPISGLLWWYSFYKKYSWRCRWTITPWNIPQSQYGTSTWIPPATIKKEKPTLAQGSFSRDTTRRTNANLL